MQISREEVEDSDTITLKRKREESTSVDNAYTERLEDTPRKKLLRKTLMNQKKYYERQVQTLKQKNKRQEKRIAQLNTVLKELKQKSLLADEHADILKTIGKSNIHLLKRLTAKSKISKNKKKFLSKEYSPELRKFALSLHYYSPKAYNYVRTHFNSCLPHPKSISKWYKSINGNPGFMQEALNSITERVKAADYPLLGTLIFDEMSIRQHIEYDGKNYSGYVDFGDGIINDNTSIAKDVLVFLFVCMNAAWKVPVGYFFINGITADQKSGLINQCICLLHDTGVKVIGLTFDGATTNLSTAKKLQCNLMPNSLQTWFPHPVTNDKIFIFPDPCHMIKLIRNLFGDMKLIIDGSNQHIKWQYISDLHDLQRQESLHLGNKLRSAHIQYKKQKMKVRFATQLFSKSVAQALQLCKENLCLPQFQDCSATIEFLLKFNYLFDIFNSKNMNQFNYKQPINSWNYTKIMDKLEECKTYILNLKLQNGTPIIDSVRKTGHVGFLICIESLKGLYNEVCEKQKLLKYIPTYKISQDHIELFFGCIRSKGSYNNNPTSRQFKAAIKKLLIHSEIRDSGSGNCIPLENIAILHVTSSQNSEQIINASTPLQSLNDDLQLNCNVTADIIEDHGYFPDIRRITEFSSRIIVYIAGFVVRHLKKSLYCEECVHALTSDDKNNDNSILIQLKSRGHLQCPSSSVTKICHEAERIIRFALAESRGKFMKKKFTNFYLVNSVLRKFTDSNNLFSNLNKHLHDQNALENHIVHLTKAIAAKYIKVRLHHICKKAMEDNKQSERHFRNKLTLFQGQ